MNPEFEKYAREQFQQQEAEVDTDELWANVYPHVKKEKSKRRFFWLFFLGLLIGMASYALIDNSSGPFDFAQGKSESESFDAELSKCEESEVTKAMDETTAKTSGELTTIASTEKINSTPTTVENTATKLTSTEQTTKQTTGSYTLKHNELKTNEKLNNKSGTNASQNISSAPQVKTENTINTSTPTSTESDLTEDKNSTVANFGSGFSSLKESSLERLQMPALLFESFEIIAIESKGSISKNILDDDEDDGRTPPALRNIRFGLGLYGGISKSSRLLSAQNDSIETVKDILDARNTYERQLETLHLGFSVLVQKKLQNNHNLYLRTGLEYTRVASVLTRESERVEIDSTDGVTEVLINNVTGQTDSIMGQVAVVRTTSYKKRTYNYTHLLDIPVVTGYQLGNYPWTIGIEAGVYINLSARYVGETARPNSTYYDLEEDDFRWYRSKLSLTPFVGVHAAYYLSENMQIYVSPGFKFPTLVSTDEYRLDEKYSHLGLRAGVRYIFD